jgi:hypothetical protein
MRFLLTVVLTLFIFTANQAAAAFEHCTDATCAESMTMTKKAEDSKDPCCPTHCAIGSHHNLGMPQSVAMTEPASVNAAPVWAERTMPESTTLEGLIEPPSLA